VARAVEPAAHVGGQANRAGSSLPRG
jgi:hypothetical protein